MVDPRGGRVRSAARPCEIRRCRQMGTDRPASCEAKPLVAITVAVLAAGLSFAIGAAGGRRRRRARRAKADASSRSHTQHLASIVEYQGSPYASWAIQVYQPWRPPLAIEALANAHDAVDMKICLKHSTNGDEPSATPYERDTGRADMDVTTPLDSPGSPVVGSGAPVLPATDEMLHSDQLTLLPDNAEATEVEQIHQQQQQQQQPDLSDKTNAVSGTTVVTAIDEVCAKAPGSAPTPTTSDAVPPAPIIALSPSLHSVASWVSDDVQAQEPLGSGGIEEVQEAQQHEPCAVGYQRLANEPDENDRLQQQQQEEQRQQQQHGDQECDIRSLPEDGSSSTGLQPLSAPESRVFYGVEGSPSAGAGAAGLTVTVTMGNPLFMEDAAAAVTAAATSSSRPHSRRRLSFSTAVDNPCFSFSEDGECSATHCRQERRAGSEAGGDGQGHQVEQGRRAEERLDVQGEHLAKEEKAAEDEEAGPRDGLRKQAATASQEEGVGAAKEGVVRRKGKQDGLQGPAECHSWEEWATVGDQSGCMGPCEQPAPSRPSTSSSSPPKVFASLQGHAEDDGACNLAEEEPPPTPQLEMAPATPTTPTTPVTPTTPATPATPTTLVKPDKPPPLCDGPLTPTTMTAMTAAAEPRPRPSLSAALRRSSSSPHPRNCGHRSLTPAPSPQTPPHLPTAAAIPASAKRTSCDSSDTSTLIARRGSTARSSPFAASTAGSRPPWRPAAAAPSPLSPASSISRTGHLADPSPSSKPNAFAQGHRNSRCNLPRSVSGPSTVAPMLPSAYSARSPGSAPSVGTGKAPFRPASKYATLTSQPPSPTPPATTAHGVATAAATPVAAGRTQSARASAALRASAGWLRLPSFMRPTSGGGGGGRAVAAASEAAVIRPGSTTSIKSSSGSKSRGGAMLAGLLSAVGVGKMKSKARRKEAAKEVSASWSTSVFGKPHWR